MKINFSLEIDKEILKDVFNFIKIILWGMFL